MRILVAYYSRDGHTEKLSIAIAKAVGADLRKVEEHVNRKGLLGYLRAGFDAMRGRESELKNPVLDVGQYDLIFFGTPVWGWKPAPAIMTYISKLSLKGKKVTNFVTMNGGCGKSEEAMRDAASLCGANVIGFFSVKTGSRSEAQYTEEGVSRAKELVKAAGR